jgi:hypothetical protein
MVVSIGFVLFFGLVMTPPIALADTGYVSVSRTEGIILSGGHVGKLAAGEVTFVIRFRTPISNDYPYVGSNGWRLYSPDGAIFSNTHIADVPGVLRPVYNLYLALFQWDGVGADSVGIVGAGTYGMAPGFDAEVLRITTVIDPNSSGKTLCLDTSFSRNGAYWEWSNLDGANIFAPEWPGPYCYEIYSCTAGPDFDHDMICDAEDNCPFVFNPDQTDTDLDGRGNACDPPPDTVDFTVVEGDVVSLFSSAVFDVDLDSYPDVVFSDPSQNGVFISYGKPANGEPAGGGLETPVNLLTVGQSVILIDYINADTLPDIGIATTDAVYILFNHGDRVFSSTPPMLIGSGGSGKSARADAVVPAVASGYFNDDDILDLAVAPNEIHIGLGDGSFSAPTILPFQFEAVNVCDFNSDGKDDLVVLSGNQIKVYLNNGGVVPSFTQGSSTTVGLPELHLPPSHAVTDFDQDGFCDFALVTPLASPAGQSAVTVVFWERTGGVVRTVSIPIQGIAYELAAADPNRDGKLDIIVANGTANRLEIFFGNGAGSFSDPQLVPLAPDVDLTYVLATLDLNRDGNPDFVSGASGGGNMQLAYNGNSAYPVIKDEAYFPMVITGYSDVNVKVINPAGFVISRNFYTVAGSDYWRVDADGDGRRDEQAVDYNVLPGLYTIMPTMDPAASPGALLSMSIGIDGSQERAIFRNYDVSGPGKSVTDDPGPVFYFPVYPPGQEPDVMPEDGVPVREAKPIITWDGLAGGSNPQYGFQLRRSLDLSEVPLEERSGLNETQYKVQTTLAPNGYFFRILFDRNGDEVYEDFSKMYALNIVNCCQGKVGNANLSSSPGDDSPTISDIQLLVYAKFVSTLPCEQNLPCLTEADMNQSGGDNPKCSDITISDIQTVVNHLFIAGRVNAPLKECL